MNLVQIGQPSVVTVQQFIEQMAAVQSAEIEQLKQAALARHAGASVRRHSRGKSPTPAQSHAA